MPGPGKQWERTLEMLQKMNQRALQAVFPLSDWLVRVDTSHLYIYIWDTRIGDLLPFRTTATNSVHQIFSAACDRGIEQ